MRQRVRPALHWRWLARCNTPVNHGSNHCCPLKLHGSGRICKAWKFIMTWKMLKNWSADTKCPRAISWLACNDQKLLTYFDWASCRVVLWKLTVVTLMPGSWLSRDISTVPSSEKQGQPAVRRTNFCKDSAGFCGFCGLIFSPIFSMGNEGFHLNNVMSKETMQFVFGFMQPPWLDYHWTRSTQLCTGVGATEFFRMRSNHLAKHDDARCMPSSSALFLLMDALISPNSRFCLSASLASPACSKWCAFSGDNIIDNNHATGPCLSSYACHLSYGMCCSTKG